MFKEKAAVLVVREDNKKQFSAELTIDYMIDPKNLTEQQRNEYRSIAKEMVEAVRGKNTVQLRPILCIPTPAYVLYIAWFKLGNVTLTVNRLQAHI